MSFRFSNSGPLSLMSLLAAHVLIWSRKRWSFLISRLRLSSNFSFCAAFVDCSIFSYIDSNSATPSDTFLKHLSTSCWSLRAAIVSGSLSRASYWMICGTCLVSYAPTSLKSLAVYRHVQDGEIQAIRLMSKGERSC